MRKGKRKRRNEPEEVKLDRLMRSFFYAIYEGETQRVRDILAKGTDPNDKSKRGSTPLSYASRVGRTEIVKLLLDNGADPNVVDEDGQTSLHGASKKASFNIVKLLLDKGADVNVRDKEGQTPLDLVKDRKTWVDLPKIKKTTALLRQYGAK